MDAPKYGEIMNFERYAQYKQRNEVDEHKSIYYITEKVDGSQWRFGINAKGEYFSGSKNVNFNEYRLPDRMFKEISERMELKLKELNSIHAFPLINDDDFICFYGEYIRSEKHNALKYDRVPRGNIYLFDVMINYKYQNPSEVIKWSEHLGLEPVNIFGTNANELPSYSKVLSLVKNSTSCLGNVCPEGAVIKNYDILITDNYTKTSSPFMVKVVRDEFKEILNKTWKADNGKSHKDIVARIIDRVNKQAVWDKAITHMRDEGKLIGKMQDMKELVPEIHREIEKEWMEIINEELFKSFEHEIAQGFIRGFPDYYKEKLYNNIVESIKNDECEKTNI